MSPHPHPNTNQTPPHNPSPIICNNNTMDMTFLVTNKCGSARNDEIVNLRLGSGVVPRVSIPCLLQDNSNTY